MSTPRHPAKQKAIELKFNSNATSASDTQTITSIPLPHHEQIDNILVLKDGRIAILDDNNLDIYADVTAFEHPPAISIILDNHVLLTKMVELSENQIICYCDSGAILCDLSNQSAKHIQNLPQDEFIKTRSYYDRLGNISVLNATQFIINTEGTGPIRYKNLIHFSLDANGSLNEISRLDLSRRGNFHEDYSRLFCHIPATTTVVIEDRDNLGHFNAFKQVDKRGLDNNTKTPITTPDYSAMNITPWHLRNITANSNGGLFLASRNRMGRYDFCIVDSTFQNPYQFYISKYFKKFSLYDLNERFIFLPDAKTIVAIADITKENPPSRMHCLLTLNIDHGFSFVEIPKTIKRLSLLPSGEILMTGDEAFFSTVDLKYMRDYRAQVAKHTAGITQLPSVVGNIVQSYLFHPSIHSREQWVDRVPMQPDDPLPEADINPASPEVKLAPQSNARRIDEFVKNALAYIKKNQSSSLFHDANSPKNIAETTVLKGLISRLTSPESKSISTAEIKNAIYAELGLCYTNLNASVETIITPVRFSGLGRVGVESLLERLLDSVSAVAQIKAKRIEAEKLDAQQRSTASSSSSSSTSLNKGGQQ